MKKGFTTRQILVVIAIIGIFVSIVIASKNEQKDTNYRVRFNDRSYYVKDYTKENNGRCVYLSELEKSFCGEWSVEKLNK